MLGHVLCALSSPGLGGGDKGGLGLFYVLFRLDSLGNIVSLSNQCERYFVGFHTDVIR